jgi:dCTP deaminase
MILTKNEILKAIKQGRIKIKPLNKSSIGPASIDLTLSDKIRVFTIKNKIIEGTDYKSMTKIMSLNKDYLLKPGELILGITKEKITLSEDLCGWLNSRSRYARIGLMSHITAPFIAPGVSNKQVLEIYNASPNIIRIKKNSKICQLVIQECKGKSKYSGIWKNQEL